MLLRESFLSKAVNGVSIFYPTSLTKGEIEKEFSVSIDSRTINAGDLFLALKGPHYDGHLYLADALKKGAAGVIIHDSRALDAIPTQLKNNAIIVTVPDTSIALVSLASSWRAQLTMPIVGITGSVGKTSTKEMLRCILQAADMDVFISHKNQNNIIGLSLNILNTPSSVACAVFEVGINAKNEMQELATTLNPTIGVITNIMHAHTKLLGSLQEVATEKKKLFWRFKASDVGIIFGDNNLLTESFYSHPVSKFGFKVKNQVQARKVHIVDDGKGGLATTFILKWYEEKKQVTLSSNHGGVVANALAASTVAYFLKIPFERVVKGIESCSGVAGRFERKPLAKYKGALIDDCYNANPSSMREALIAFDQLPTSGKKIVVLGDMLELGEKEVYWHRQVGRILTQTTSIDKVILVGELSRQVLRTCPAYLNPICVDSWQAVKPLLDKELASQESLLLVKASNGIKLKNLVDYLSI